MGWWPMAWSGSSPAEIDEVWRQRWSGQAVRVVARQMRYRPSTVRDLLKKTGGIRPVAAAGKLRLSPAERKEAMGERHAQCGISGRVRRGRSQARGENIWCGAVRVD